MKNKYILAASKIWFSDLVDNLVKKTSEEFALINKKSDLNLINLKEIKPQVIFFSHWSYFIPTEIYEQYNCVIFHMTDVPFGRGGSPLQNLIVRGINETMVSALKCTGEVDAGPVYLKKPLTLEGSAQEIYKRANRIIEDMIVEIVTKKLNPFPQVGEAVYFTRRKSEESNIGGLKKLDKVYDYIRMLDADGYPHAYLETEYLHLEFCRASLTEDEIVAEVRITRKKNATNSSSYSSSSR